MMKGYYSLRHIYFQGPPVTTLIDIPDDELSEAEKKEKRKQKLMKANYDARERAKKAKEEAKAREVCTHNTYP